MNSDPLLFNTTKYVEGYFHNLLSWSELADLINIRPLMTDKRVHLLGLGKRFEWLNSTWTSDPDCFPPSLIRSLLDKIVIYFTDMSRATKNINDMAKLIEEQYNKQVDAHIYVCRDPKIEHPFGAHYDFSDNVIIQCEGMTNFKVWEEDKNAVRGLTGLGINTKINMTTEPILDVNMKPGDAIWIPRNFPHLATSVTPRLSVSFPLSYKSDVSKYGEDRNWITL